MASRRQRADPGAGRHASLSLALGVTIALSATATAQDTRALPISKAILERDLGAVRRLVEGGQDIDQRLFNGATPAIMAASSDSWDIVLYLMEAGADPSLQNRMGVTIASMAATSRVASGTREHAALTKVKAILSARGLIH